MRIVKFMLGGTLGGFVGGGVYTLVFGRLDILDIQTYGATFAAAVGGMIAGLVAGALYGVVSKSASDPSPDGADG